LLACHVTQIHPTRPLFAATGDWAGASIYQCPEGEGRSNTFGAPIKYIQEQGSRRGQSEKKAGSFGQSLTFHPSGRVLAVGTNKGMVSVFDLETKETLAVLQNHSDTIRALEFTPTGELLVGSDQASVTMYDLRVRESGGTQSSLFTSADTYQVDYSYIDTLKGHKTWITSVKVAPDPNYVASSSVDGQVKLWDVRMEPNRSVAIFQAKEEMPVWSLSWNPKASATSFVTGSGGIKKTAHTPSFPTSAVGNVRWYQLSGST
jgi:WD40 repeat protein